jgi:hypothetical protein
MKETDLIKLQEIYFDLCTCLDNNSLEININGLEEFNSLREFIIEQKEKIEDLLE